jgi:hypothetical protein
MYIPLDTPYKMSSDFSINYFTNYLVNKNATYRISIQPISNCHPKLYIGESYKNPTNETPSYGDIRVTTTDTKLAFSILAESQCLYFVTLSSNIYENVLNNCYYTLQTSKD